MDAKQAAQTNLAIVNDAGNAIMRVDNTTSGLTFGDKRNSIRISSKQRYTVGSLWIADILHLPYGVSKSASIVLWVQEMMQVTILVLCMACVVVVRTKLA